MPTGWLLAVGLGYSVRTPEVVSLPIWSLPNCVNHKAPSGPATTAVGWVPTFVIVYSVSEPAVVILPSLLAFCSANHTAPSEPSVIPQGRLLSVGMEYL